ncbi:transcription factor bHLH95-like [Salvia divinorum]|uniref:Transcription factor bHLH95-like n=1 Tax=Salvia divinorum TaxID=28513 RepID=A0ABD1GJJ0_SALDI
MADEVDHDIDNSLLWNDDQSWTFPVLPVEDDVRKVLIDSGRIVTDTEQQRVNEKGKNRAGGNDSDDHIRIERERRKKMRDMFATLHDLIPHLHPRADKSSIVDEAVKYIKQLRLILEDLEKQEEKLKGVNGKLSVESSASQQRPPANLNASFTTLSYPNVVVSVCGIDAHINVVCSPTKPRTITYLVFVIDMYNLELVSAHASSGVYMLHVRANGVPQQFPEAAPFLVEETYKQVAAELMLWINS